MHRGKEGLGNQGLHFGAMTTSLSVLRASASLPLPCQCEVSYTPVPLRGWGSIVRCWQRGEHTGACGKYLWTRASSQCGAPRRRPCSGEASAVSVALLRHRLPSSVLPLCGSGRDPASRRRRVEQSRNTTCPKIRANQLVGSGEGDPLCQSFFCMLQTSLKLRTPEETRGGKRGHISWAAVDKHGCFRRPEGLRTTWTDWDFRLLVDLRRVRCDGLCENLRRHGVTSSESSRITKNTLEKNLYHTPKSPDTVVVMCRDSVKVLFILVRASVKEVSIRNVALLQMLLPAGNEVIERSLFAASNPMKRCHSTLCLSAAPLRRAELDDRADRPLEICRCCDPMSGIACLENRTGRGETGDPRENPPTSGIVRHESHMREYGNIPAGNLTMRSGKLSVLTACECWRERRNKEPLPKARPRTARRRAHGTAVTDTARACAGTGATGVELSGSPPRERIFGAADVGDEGEVVLATLQMFPCGIIHNPLHHIVPDVSTTQRYSSGPVHNRHGARNMHGINNSSTTIVAPFPRGCFQRSSHTAPELCTPPSPPPPAIKITSPELAISPVLMNIAYPRRKLTILASITKYLSVFLAQQIKLISASQPLGYVFAVVRGGKLPLAYGKIQVLQPPGWYKDPLKRPDLGALPMPGHFSPRKETIGRRWREGRIACIFVCPPASYRLFTPLVRTVFDNSWRTLIQSSPFTVTADNQCAVDFDIFAHKTVETSLKVIRIAKFSCL
ncbi:hypothetical protein PR048_017689 [Dryococelus australis]|uniref:Uncharacterized protein n=1 Tax=Dryococelus australis TaxID=614101 RepID=A0ABQ9HAG0_9NEOP|nr:hypothetical protein PR048_017689 [Dryococelus australis]